MPATSPDEALHIDDSPTGKYFVWFWAFPTDIEAAKKFLATLIGNRPGVRAVIDQGTAGDVARAMYQSKYFTGVHKGDDEANIGDYAKNVAAKALPIESALSLAGWEPEHAGPALEDPSTVRVLANVAEERVSEVVHRSHGFGTVLLAGLVIGTLGLGTRAAHARALAQERGRVVMTVLGHHTRRRASRLARGARVRGRRGRERVRRLRADVEEPRRRRPRGLVRRLGRVPRAATTARMARARGAIARAQLELGMPDSVIPVEDEWQGLVHALAKTPGTTAKGDLQDLYNRLCAAQGKPIDLSRMPQPTATDADLGVFKAADAAIKAGETAARRVAPSKGTGTLLFVGVGLGLGLRRRSQGGAPMMASTVSPMTVMSHVESDTISDLTRFIEDQARRHCVRIVLAQKIGEAHHTVNEWLIAEMLDARSRKRGDLSLQFELYGAEIGEVRVLPRGVVKGIDVVGDGGVCHCRRRVVVVVHPLGFQGCEEALGNGIVETVAGATHAGDDAGGLERRPVLLARVRAAAVGVVDQRSRGAPRSQGSIQGCPSQGGVIRLAGRPADDTPREEVQEDGEIQPSRDRPDVGDVPHPSFVGSAGVEVPLEHVRRDGIVVARVGRVDEPSLSPAAEALLTHQSLNPLLADAQPLVAQLEMNPRASIDAAAAFVGKGYLNAQPSVFGSSRRRRTLLHRVVAALRNAQDLAHDDDGEGHLLRGYEVELHSLSFAKKVAAAFRMSLAHALHDTGLREAHTLRESVAYGVFAFRSDSSVPAGRFVFRIEAGTDLQGRTVTPDERGLIAMLMQHTESSARLSLGHSREIVDQYQTLLGQGTGHLTRLLEQAYARIRVLEARETEAMNLRDKLQSAAAERAGQLEALKRKDEMRKFALEKLGPMVPIIMAKLLGSGVGAAARPRPAQEAPSRVRRRPWPMSPPRRTAT